MYFLAHWSINLYSRNVVQDRRPGDVASCYAKPDLANSELRWTAELGLKEMCEDMWRWQVCGAEGGTRLNDSAALAP